MKFYKNSEGNTIFYGTIVPQRDIERGWLSFAALVAPFNCILCNNILSIGGFDVYNGEEVDEYGDYVEIAQCFVIDKDLANVLKRETEELIYFRDSLGMYVWAVTSCGTAWEYVNSDIRIEY